MKENVANERQNKLFYNIITFESISYYCLQMATSIDLDVHLACPRNLNRSQHPNVNLLS